MSANSKQSPVKIELTEDYAKIEYSNNGVKMERIGDITQLMDVFKAIDTTIVLPILPNNCRGFIKKGNTVYLFLYYEEAVIDDFQYHDKKVKIPVPRTLLMITLNDLSNGRYSLRGSTFFPIVEPYLNSNDIDLYFWPFPNQSPTFRGEICWGNDPSIKMFRDGCDMFNVGSIYRLYFSARANDDYGWNCKDAGSSHGTPMPDFFRNQEKFPYEKLKTTGFKLKALIKDLISGTRSNAEAF